MRSRESGLAWANIAAILGILAAGIALYAGTLFYAPVWDDHSFVFGDPFVMGCRNLGAVLDPRHLFWVLPVQNAARPVWLASVLADSCIYGGEPAGYRLTSILLHAASGAAMLVLARRLSGSRCAAVLAACLFVAHPVHTESVNLITFRTDILCFLFMVPSLLAYLEAREASGSRRAARLFASAACFLLAMLAKEMAVVLPGLMAAADFVFPSDRAGRARPSLRIYAVFAALLAAFLVFRMPRTGYQMRGHSDLFTEIRDKVPELRPNVSPRFLDSAAAPVLQEQVPWGRVYADPGARFLTMSAVFGSHLRLLAWPHPLQGDYAPKPRDSPWSPGVLASWAAWAGLLVFAWKQRRSRPLLSFALAWIPLTLLPVSGLVALLNLQAERYLFIPSAGWSLAAAAVLAELAGSPGRRRKAAAAALGAGLVCLYGALTVRRNRAYADERAYFEATLAADPTVGRAHLNLAGLSQLEGRAAEAEKHYELALRHWPQSARGRNQYALFLLTQGRPEDALAQLKTALVHEPDSAWLRYNLGIVHRENGNPDSALAQFDAASRLEPESPDAWLAAGEALLDLKSPGEAARRFRKGLAAAGGNSTHGIYGLARAERALGNLNEARRLRALLSRSSPELAVRIDLP